LAQAGYVITGSGGGGAGGQYVFANLDEMDGIIAEAKVLCEEIQEDGEKLRRAQALIEPPGDDVMSRIEAQTTVNSLEKAIEHNEAMFAYTGAQLAKLRAARDAYANTEDESAARLRGVGEG
jgi:hypothetical protein